MYISLNLPQMSTWIQGCTETSCWLKVKGQGHQGSIFALNHHSPLCYFKARMNGAQPPVKSHTIFIFKQTCVNMVVVVVVMGFEGAFHLHPLFNLSKLPATSR